MLKVFSFSKTAWHLFYVNQINKLAMKKIIFTVVIAATFVACSSKKEESTGTATTQNILASDTAGLAEYQAWRQQKDQMQPIDMNGVGGVVGAQPNTSIPVVAETPKPVTKIIYRDRVVKSKRTAPDKEYYNQSTEFPNSYPKPVGPTREAVSRNDAGVGNSGTQAGNASGTGTTDGAVVVNKPTEVPPKKEGWSKAAKGAAIGAASGAVVGAIISKNKGLGAVIGGVAGGLGGYAIGRSKDKKDGRYLVVN